MRNCPNCGTPMTKGWCPRCHPNPRMTGANKMIAIGQVLQSAGCIISLVVFVLVPLCFVAYACATASW